MDHCCASTESDLRAHRWVIHTERRSFEPWLGSVVVERADAGAVVIRATLSSTDRP